VAAARVESTTVPAAITSSTVMPFGSASTSASFWGDEAKARLTHHPCSSDAHLVDLGAATDRAARVSGRYSIEEAEQRMREELASATKLRDARTRDSSGLVHVADSSSTINAGGWSTSSSRFPITRSVLLPRWIVSPAPQ